VITPILPEEEPTIKWWSLSLVIVVGSLASLAVLFYLIWWRKRHNAKMKSANGKR
jgi:hypothetical protein